MLRRYLCFWYMYLTVPSIPSTLVRTRSLCVPVPGNPLFYFFFIFHYVPCPVRKRLVKKKKKKGAP